MSNIGPTTTTTDHNDPQPKQQQQQKENPKQQKGNDDVVIIDWKQLGAVPTTLLRRIQIITEGLDRLPVYTATFALPPDIITTTNTPNETNNNNNTNTNTPTKHFKIKSHSQIRIDLGDVIKMIIPNYKPKSYSISSIRLDQNEFDITYKLYPNGRASSYIHSLIPMTMDTSKQIYTFVKQSNRYHNPGTHIGIIVYGVGITEGLPIARAELERSSSSSSSTNSMVQKVTLIWCARTIHDTFWYNHIQQLLLSYPTKFHMIYILSRQQQQQHIEPLIQPTLSISISQTKEQQIGNSNDQKEIDTTTTPSNSTSSTPSYDMSPVVSSNTNTNNNNNTNNTEQYIYGQRLNETILHSIFVTPYENFYKDTTRFVIAGTKEMISSTECMLHNIGYIDMKIKHSLLPKMNTNKNK